MTAAQQAPLGRRERNKQDKLNRIIESASALFSKHGVDEVTTQMIAEHADIGAGTLFLYAKTKGELLLLVQNVHYAQALAQGRAAAANIDSPLDAVMAIVTEIVTCNRVHVDNGRTYLREMVFGNPAEPHHAEALRIVAETDEAIVEVLTRTGMEKTEQATTLARIVSAIMFVSMAASPNAAASEHEVVGQIRQQCEVLIS
ncbi:TetR/AcrR family transcriptional regulator [Humidisolicoccus flavus]|uniref:TetR/AcrR family transcriptional regulator n=1 Tax=Humidisolicoccus flavus TaxID=3111414 RepID=UPI0032538EE3